MLKHTRITANNPPWRPSFKHFKNVTFLFEFCFAPPDRFLADSEICRDFSPRLYDVAHASPILGLFMPGRRAIDIAPSCASQA